MSNGLGWIAAAAGLTLPAESYFARAATLAPGWPVPRNNMALLRPLAHIAPLAPRYLLIKAWGFGFWSEVTHLLGQLLIAELTGRVPVVHWGPNCLFWDGSLSNAFDAYFQPISAVTPQTLRDASGSIWPPKWDHHNLLDGAIHQWSGPYSRLAGLYLLGRTEQVLVADFFSSVLEIRPWIPPQSALYTLGVDELYCYLVEKYLRPTAEIATKVQAWYATHLAAAPFLAVHVRGSDKVTEMPDLAAIKGAYETSIEQFRSQFDLRRIFLMTDDARLREELQQAYGEDLISTECRRSASAEGVHYQGGYNRRELGVEVMVDAYLAARGSAFIGNGFSNPSVIVSYLRDWPRPRMKLIGPHMFHTRNLTLHRRD